MEELFERQKDAEIRKLLKDVPLEEPSPDFTTNVMLGIHEEALQKATAYRPLISRGFWAIIAMLFCLVIVLSIYSSPDSGMDSLAFMNWDLDPALSFLNKVADVGLSKALSYGTLALAVSIFAQLFLLKGQLDKRISVS